MMSVQLRLWMGTRYVTTSTGPTNSSCHDSSSSISSSASDGDVIESVPGGWIQLAVTLQRTCPSCSHSSALCWRRRLTTTHTTTHTNHTNTSTQTHLTMDSLLKLTFLKLKCFCFWQSQCRWHIASDNLQQWTSCTHISIAQWLQMTDTLTSLITYILPTTGKNPIGKTNFLTDRRRRDMFDILNRLFQFYNLSENNLLFSSQGGS
jgi:hypothetical protein